MIPQDRRRIEANQRRVRGVANLHSSTSDLRNRETCLWPKNFVAESPANREAFVSRLVTTFSPAFAVIDGNLCRLNRTGSVSAVHAPLATAVMEFRPGPMRLYVREHPYGLLPGVPNVYCVDPSFRMLWLAEWPFADDLCAKLVDEVDDTLVVETGRGTTLRLDAATGRVIANDTAIAAAV